MNGDFYYRVQILENRPRAAVHNNNLPPLLFLTCVVQTFPVDGGIVDVLVLNESVWTSQQIKYLNGAVYVCCIAGDDQRFQSRFRTDRLSAFVNDEMWRDFFSGDAEETRALRMHTKGRIVVNEATPVAVRDRCHRPMRSDSSSVDDE